LLAAAFAQKRVFPTRSRFFAASSIAASMKQCYCTELSFVIWNGEVGECARFARGAVPAFGWPNCWDEFHDDAAFLI
jgi:hypothetical protein